MFCSAATWRTTASNTASESVSLEDSVISFFILVTDVRSLIWGDLQTGENFTRRFCCATVCCAGEQVIKAQFKLQQRCSNKIAVCASSAGTSCV